MSILFHPPLPRTVVFLSFRYERPMASHREAYVSMLTNDSYLPGLEALLSSLVSTGTRRELVVVVTPNVSRTTRSKLAGTAARVVEVEPLGGPEEEASGTSWSGSGYTKLRVWELCEYAKIVFVDADAVVLENVDDLFERNVDFAAAPDVFPPDKFNAGVFLATPSKETFENMRKAIPLLTSHDRGDTGFLNSFFGDWYQRPPAARLPFRYNAQRTLYWMTHDREPGYWEACKPIKVLHFSSSPKPWQSTNKKGHLDLIWWHHYLARQHIKQTTSTSNLLASFLGEEEGGVAQNIKKATAAEGLLSSLGGTGF